jgi:hypothetical protein
MRKSDTLTDREYHHTMMVWINIVQDVKLFWISSQNLIMVILICVEDAILKGLENIGLLLVVEKLRLMLLIITTRRTEKKSTLVIWQNVILTLQTGVLTVVRLVGSMLTTQIIQNPWKLFGSVGNATPLFIGKNGIV